MESISLISDLSDRLHQLKISFQGDFDLDNSYLIETLNVLRRFESLRKSSQNCPSFPVLSCNVKETIVDMARYIKTSKTGKKKILLEIFLLILKNLPAHDLNDTYIYLFQLMKEELKKDPKNSLEKVKDHLSNFCIAACILNLSEYNDSNLFESDSSVLIDEKLLLFLFSFGISSSDKNCSVMLFSSIIPVFIDILNDGALVAKMWDLLSDYCVNHVCNKFYYSGIGDVGSHGDTCLAKKLSILCLFIDYFISLEKDTESPVIKDEKFWSLICCGLMSSDLLLRKQSIYLARRAINFLETSNALSITTCNFIWDTNYRSEHVAIWTDYFIILEVLEEKQVHLVTPMLSTVVKLLLNKTFISVEGRKYILLHDCWILCICQRIFVHDSSTIIRWGLTNILKYDCIDWTEINIKLFSRLVFTTLNNTSLFLHQSKTDNTFQLELMKSLQYWFLKFISEDCGTVKNLKKCFFENCITLLNEIIWSPVPLFYLMKSLSNVRNLHCLGVSSLEILKKFIREALKTQSVYIRGAIQCLTIQFIINSVDVGCIDNVQFISDLLVVFRSEECFKRGSVTWNKVTSWLKTFLSVENCTKYIYASIGSLAVGNYDYHIPGLARFTVLLSDANLFRPNDICHGNSHETKFIEIENLFKEFKDSYNRPYMNLKGFDKLLSYVANVIKESESIGNITSDINSDKTKLYCIPVVEPVIKSYADEIFLFIRQKLNLLCFQTNEMESFNIYFSSLAVFTSDLRLLSFVSHNEHFMQIICDAYCTLKDGDSNPLKKYFSAKLICLYCKLNFVLLKNITSPFHSQHSHLIKNLLNSGQINEILKLDSGTDSIKSNSEIGWNKIVCEYINCCWIILYYYLVYLQDPSDIIMNESMVKLRSLLTYGLEALEIGGREIAFTVNKTFKIILPFVINSSDVSKKSIIRFISLSWVSCFELRKLESFWKVFKSWVEMVFQEMLIENVYYRLHLIEYINHIFEKSDTVSGLIDTFVTHLTEEINRPAILNLLCDVLIKSLVFGPIHRKDLRIEYDTSLYIKSLGSVFSINTLKPMSTVVRDDLEVRLKTLDLIIKSVINRRMSNNYYYNATVSDVKNCEFFIIDNDGMVLLMNVIESLMEFDDIISSKNQRYFNDSLHHRIKNRVLQALLLLQNLIYRVNKKFVSIPNSSSTGVIVDKTVEVKELHEMLVEWISNNLCKESQQPSIRYQLEWLLVRSILCYPEFVEKFWNLFLKCSERRVGSVCSFISVAYHLAVMLKQQSFIDQCFREILQWCMAQQFNIRLYAQVVLIKLFDLLDVISKDELPVQYAVIKCSLLKSLEQGTSTHNAKRLMSDFYFNVFHPSEHFSLKSIFNDLPRLSSISPDECISDDVLSQCFKSTIDFKLIPFCDDIHVAVTTENSTPVHRVSLSECQPPSWTVRANAESSKQKNVSDGMCVVQKKFVPWYNNNIEIDRDLSISNANRSNLIVVASLIDRPPNLGGLCRTCEVFGVDQLVLDGLHYLNDKQFTSLSMSSEKHINITEVKQYHLKDYLLTMRDSHNYTLVGAEQTATGIKLNKFKFPEKTLLLLGNEKQGIPADLLSLLDVCVEIPQLGIIRSLNVHVTGAIFIWEFTKQQR